MSEEWVTTLGIILSLLIIIAFIVGVLTLL